ncbi:S8 family serine peptidase [Gemmobacter fulvus]|uniref:S8 family serine peptidase n=1 Tax=Gemmobacter fulvus TaxID=2840474 RepID=UPI002796AE79|nr:S8 family serine peptidase [Gemmobacter fulvus]MDQ1850519.1 S8 family serine peptidase [Gemmobacter fulvus]
MPLPTDPLLSQQWHLGNPTFGLLDLNVRSVWNPTEGPAYTGAGTRVFVIDDGFDYTHSDLAPNYNIGLDFDFETNVTDAFGGAGDAHGTAVAGIIGAASNGTGAVGVAFDTNIVGYRTYGFISDQWLQDIRDAIFFAGSDERNGDVMNISQGIANDENSEFGVGYNAVRFDEIENSIRDAVGLGRGGLGTSIVKSAGNSRSDNYDVNADDWTNDTRQIVVSAVNQDGFVSSYSSYGAALLVSGFGTPGQVVTTDRVGAAGYNSTDFTSSFNGTSSAAPMVTGVVALMYDAESGLGWRDVQSILGASSQHVGSAIGGGLAGAERYAWGWNAANTWNGGGQHFSNDYGYGLVDAHAAVRMAESWLLTGESSQRSSNEFTNTMDVLNSATVIPDGNATGLSFSGNAAFDDIVERVTVQMTFSTTFTADMEIYLISPDGTVSELIDDVAGSTDYNGTWTFESQAFRGERAQGTWTVRVVDDAGGDVLTVSDIVIRTYGVASSNDRYVFTNEYSDYDGIAGHATAISDSNGGTDTVNASAVTSNSVIRLDGVAGSIDGVGVSFTNIEHAIGGDGNDDLYGSSAINQLHGMRGADELFGGQGLDTLYGGTGNDTLNGGLDKDSSYGGDGNDRFVVSFGNYGDNAYGGSGTDTLDMSAALTTVPYRIDLAAQLYEYMPNGEGSNGTYDLQSVENVVGSTGSDSITGDGVSNVLSGNDGNDTITGGSGLDTIYGGTGNDVIDGGLDKDDLYGGDGNDRFLLTGYHYAGNVYGGNDTDTLDMRDPANAEAFEVNLTSNFYRFMPNSYGLNGTYDLFNVENVVGTTNADSITGDTGANDLNDGGIGGNDTLTGLQGDDTYRLYNSGAILVEAAGQGYDRVHSAVSFTLAGDDSIELLTTNSGAGLAAINLTGNGFAQRITGNDAANTLSDGGGAGVDTLEGRSGDDIYRVGNAGAIILEAAGQGNDRLHSSVSFTLAGDDSIEWLTTNSGAGLAAINLTGNGFAQRITGNDGANTLSDGGGAGADTLEGRSGDDIYRVGHAGAIILEAAGQGNDRLHSSVSFTLAGDDSIEWLTTSSGAGVTPLNLTGNGFAQRITGNDGANTLNDGGGAGADTLEGRSGDDIYRISNFSAIILENAGQGYDRVLTSVNFALAADDNIEYMATTSGAGVAAINLRGNALAQVINGNAGNNRLDGQGGNDTITGGNGADTFVFNSTLGATNVDRILDFNVAADTIELENTFFAGLVNGALAAAAFTANLTGAATDALDRIIYETDTGNLFFDADGTGAGAAIRFAQLNAGLGVTNADFFVV